jgi:hypothetical protein
MLLTLKKYHRVFTRGPSSELRYRLYSHESPSRKAYL